VAYYLSLQQPPTGDQQIHLVEIADEMFASASGKAGGFLAEDCTSAYLSSSLLVLSCLYDTYLDYGDVIGPPHRGLPRLT
jgi:hypothetical protein